jgi:hypothetical protein
MDVRRETAVVSLEHLDAATHSPQGGFLAGDVVDRHADSAGREVIRVDTWRPCPLESAERHDPVRVLLEALVRWGEPEK